MHFQKRNRFVLVAAFAALLAHALVPTCWGQFETAAVLGTVLDAHGGGIPRASVSLEDLDTGTTQAALADASVRFLEFSSTVSSVAHYYGLSFYPDLKLVSNNCQSC